MWIIWDVAYRNERQDPSISYRRTAQRQIFERVVGMGASWPDLKIE